MEAAFFDLDKTIISRSSSLALGRPLYRAGMVSRGQLMRGAYAQLVYLLIGADESRMDKLKEGMLQLTKGWDRTQVERLVHDVMLEVIDPFVYQEALDLIAEHQSAGRRIYIVSSSPEEVVRPLARHFGVSGVIATRAQVGADNRYTGELEFYAYGEHKAEAIRSLASRARVNLETSFAYSDSVTDVPMLEAVGHPVVVNPDRHLARIAKERGWPVLRFEKLRTRLRVGGAAAVAAAAGGAATAVARRRR
jgi:HAD superfamily hydrolase (TIGR01490 family)